MNFFKWLGSKMNIFKNKEGQISKKRVAVGGGLTTAALVPAAVFIAMTGQVGAPMTAQFEGMVLKNYIDTVGVETWCIGETQMGRLESGYTEEYCMTLFNAQYPKYAAQLYSCYTEQMKRYVTPSMHAAFTDVYYNTGAKCSTGMMRNLKKGQPVEACDYTLRYKRAGGKDCSERSNNCWGVWDRRVKMHPVCVNDAKQIPPQGIGQEDVIAQ